MTTLFVLLALAAVVLYSARAGRAPDRRLHLDGPGWFFLLLISSFLGCCIEMGIVWLGTGTLMSRSSLLYGAFSLVWGAGALLMTWILYPLRQGRAWTLFASGAVLGAGFEYLASLGLELAYHRLFWDYSHLPLNLDGRTNLLYAAFWGAAGLVWIRILLPRLLPLLALIPARGGRAAARFLAILLALDVALSAAAFQRMAQRGAGQPPDTQLEFLLDRWYSDEVMQHRYQNMTLSPGAVQTSNIKSP